MKKKIICILMILLTILIIIITSFKVIRKDFNYVELMPFFISDVENEYISYVKNNYEDEYNYYSYYINKYLNSGGDLDIDKDKLLSDINVIIDDLNKKHNLNINKDIIEGEVDKVLYKIQDIRVFQDNSDYLKIIKLIFNNYFYYFFILLTFIDTLLIIILSEVKRILRNISIPVIISGMVLLAIGLVLKNMYYDVVLLALFNNLFISGLIIFSVGIVLMFVNQLLFELVKKGD